MKTKMKTKMETKMETANFQIGDKVKLQDGYNNDGTPKYREYTISKTGLRGSGERINDTEYYLTSPGTIGFDATAEWINSNKI